MGTLVENTLPVCHIIDSFAKELGPLLLLLLPLPLRLLLRSTVKGRELESSLRTRTTVTPS